MENRRYYYISTGNLNGFYTLRVVGVSGMWQKEHFIKNLSRDWDVAYKAAKMTSERTGHPLITNYNDQWDLSEWGSGKEALKFAKAYYRWKAYLLEGTMPFGKYQGERLENLPADYRNWLRDQNEGDRAWNLLRDYLKPWEEEDHKAKEFLEAKKAEKQSEIEAARALSEFVGDIGNRLERKLTCVAKFGFSSYYGDGTLSVLKDEAGNSIKTFGACPIDKDETKLVKFTVKQHSEYKGEKQTIVNRLKVL